MMLPDNAFGLLQLPKGMQGIASLVAAVVFFGFPVIAGAAEAGKPRSTLCESPSQRVHQEHFVPIGGAEQWVTIKGESCANPVILFLHGGPGNTLSPYADSIYGSWEKEFTLVQWDQRAAGRTYGRNPPPAESTLTIERMTEDGVELAKYLAQQLGKKKIILMGGSWGSILGVYMAKARPDLFYAYVGVSQIVSYRENQSASYSKVLAMARAAGDQRTVAALEALGPPPWENPRNSGILRRATRAYEAKTSGPAPESWWVRSPAYATPQMRADYLEGEDFSYLQFVGLKGDGMFSKVDLPRLGRVFEIPVFVVHGSEDLVAVPDVAKRYFDGISAPQMEFVLVPYAGHDPNAAIIAAQHRIMSQRVRPLTK
jgi:pimeloyl-ACP methyl ester carboxylesterase